MREENNSIKIKEMMTATVDLIILLKLMFYPNQVRHTRTQIMYLHGRAIFNHTQRMHILQVSYENK